MTDENKDAVFHIGEMYYKGGRSDLERAKRYFKIAYEKKHDRAAYYLGVLEENEAASERPDLQKAITYYRAGARYYDERCWKRLKNAGKEQVNNHVIRNHKKQYMEYNR